MKLCSFSQIGSRRTNQDRVLTARLRDGRDVLAVADGVGGCPGGDVAAEIAISRLHSFLVQSPTSPIEDIFGRIHQAILQRGVEQPQLNGLATTLSMVTISDRKLSGCHIGDSRVYLQSGRALTQLTLDHTLGMDLYMCGALSDEEVNGHPTAHVLTAALGMNQNLIVQEFTHEALSKDRVMVLSDGVTGVLSNDEISDLSSATPDLTTFSYMMQREIQAKGESDNYSAALIEL